jgi:SsrA-binding protein
MELVNKEGYREFTIIETYEAGVKLTGPEVKAIRDNRLVFKGSFIKFMNKELYWINAEIPQYKYAHLVDYEPKRTRKILLKTHEIVRLQGKIKEHPGLTIIPLKCYTKHSFLKLEIALSKGKKAYEIKSVEKNRDIKRHEKQAAKEYLKK